MNQNELRQPFFAQFLEKQRADDKQHVTTVFKDDPHTLKYPSDGDDDPGIS